MRRRFHRRSHRRPQAKEHLSGHQPLTLSYHTWYPAQQELARLCLSLKDRFLLTNLTPPASARMQLRQWPLGIVRRCVGKRRSFTSRWTNWFQQWSMLWFNHQPVYVRWWSVWQVYISIILRTFKCFVDLTCKFFMAIESTTIYPGKLLAPLDFGPWYIRWSQKPSDVCHRCHHLSSALTLHYSLRSNNPVVVSHQGGIPIWLMVIRLSPKLVSKVSLGEHDIKTHFEPCKLRLYLLHSDIS
jgi:hypothetical protein